MPITVGNTTISGLGVGGLPSGVVNATTLATSAVTRTKIGFQGAVIQTVHNFTDSTGGFSNISTHLETFITPTSTNSRILIMGTLSGDGRADDSVVGLQYRIGGGAWQYDSVLNSRVQTFSGIGDMAWAHKSNGGPFPFTIYSFFHPNTTAQVGIRFYIDQESTGTFWLNRSSQAQDNSENFGTGRTTMFLSEIRGP
jgi:hypothetical protein